MDDNPYQAPQTEGAARAKWLPDGGWGIGTWALVVWGTAGWLCVIGFILWVLVAPFFQKVYED